MVTLVTRTRIHAPITVAFDLARSVEVHLAGNVHCGEQAIAVAGVTTGLVGLHQRVTWRARHFGVRHTLTTEITEMGVPLYFQETMRSGPFRIMRHDHLFRSLALECTEMENTLQFAAPLPFLGRIAEITVLRRYMLVLLEERNAVVKEIAEA